MDSREICTDPRLTDFLAEYLGRWTEADGLTVVGSPARTLPGWDGKVRDVVGVSTPRGGVLSVAPDTADAVRDAVRTWDDVAARLPVALGRPDATAYRGVFRWTTGPADLPDAGEWVPALDPRVPEWLHPFGGHVLITFDDAGRYAAGVGVKRHNPAGMEISVGTEEAHRGRGLATALVAQAARWIIAQGAVPIYLHDPENTASDRTARSAGFPDLGWHIVGVGGRPLNEPRSEQSTPA
ncbi:GNAT family N-acetyltransferase [Catellatospora methionotrophica]|uniref:GNAT family N-acetyltransferase n=1 Tax=Catellatospora methionotrophica TaxID=121620 RepID=UPI00341032CF